MLVHFNSGWHDKCGCLCESVVHDYNSDGLVGFQEDAWLTITCFDL